MTKLCQSCTNKTSGLYWDDIQSAFSIVTVCRIRDLLKKLGSGQYDDIVEINHEVTECEFYKERKNHK